jgi:hypothetical protein
MNDTDFHHEQLSLFDAFCQRLQVIAADPAGAGLAELASQFDDLAKRPEQVMDEAPALVARMLTVAPQLTEHFPRDLLWYLGGECLHFMPDDEIERLTTLDDQRRAANAEGLTFNWRQARSAALGLQ